MKSQEVADATRLDRTVRPLNVGAAIRAAPSRRRGQGNPTMAIRGLIFDIENTFFDGSYWHRLLHQMICGLGLREQFQNFREQWQSNYLPKVYQGEMKYWDALASFFCSLGLAPAEARELLASSQAKLQHAQANLRPLATVVETLDELQRREFRMGIVCNSIHQSHALLGILADIHIRQRFDTVLTSRSLGRVMPDREALQQATREMLLSPAESLYVSQRPSRLRIAAQSGLVPIWLVAAAPVDAVPEEGGDGMTPHLISQFSELVTLMARLETAGTIL